MSGIRLNDELIAKASGLKAHIEELTALYAQVPGFLEADKRALAASDLMTLEALSVRKLAVAEAIEENFGRLKDSITEIERFVGAIHDSPRLATPVTLSGVLGWLTAFGTTLQQEKGFAVQVFRHLTAGLEKLGTELLEQHRVLRPALEANKFMLERVLAFKQESFRFWQDVANVTMSNYNAQGAQKSTSVKSVLQIRA